MGGAIHFFGLPLPFLEALGVGGGGGGLDFLAVTTAGGRPLAGLGAFFLGADFLEVAGALLRLAAAVALADGGALVLLGLGTYTGSSSSLESSSSSSLDSSSSSLLSVTESLLKEEQTLR